MARLRAGSPSHPETPEASHRYGISIGATSAPFPYLCRREGGRIQFWRLAAKGAPIPARKLVAPEKLIEQKANVPASVARSWEGRL